MYAHFGENYRRNGVKIKRFQHDRHRKVHHCSSLDVATFNAGFFPLSSHSDATTPRRKRFDLWLWGLRSFLRELLSLCPTSKLLLFSGQCNFQCCFFVWSNFDVLSRSQAIWPMTLRCTFISDRIIAIVASELDHREKTSTDSCNII